VENQDQNTNVTAVSDGNGENIQISDQQVVGTPLNVPEALSLDVTPDNTVDAQAATLAEFGGQPVDLRTGLANGSVRRIFLLIILLLIAGIAIVLSATAWSKKNRAGGTTTLSVTTQYGTQTVPLNGFKTDLKGTNFGTNNVVINGLLTANSGFIIAPSVQPNNPATGQFYLDQNTGQLAYFNGKAYVPLGEQSTTVQSLGGASGALTLGGGLSVVNNQLTVTFPDTTVPEMPDHVDSIDGQTGAITLGAGLHLDGNTLQNAGVLTIAAGAGIGIADDGAGNLTITNTGVAGNVVTTAGGTNGTIALFNAGQSIGDSLLSQAGTTITLSGDQHITGGLTLGNQLTVSNGGTGALSLAANGIVVANGTAPLSSVTAASAGLCLVSTVGVPAFMACPSATGVISLNGLTGALAVANASTTGSLITIDDASATNKGIASFNSANFTVNSGDVNTVQNISSTATPTFSGVNTNTITPSGSLTIGSASQSFTVQGTSSSVFTITGNGFNTNVGFNGTATGNVNYNLDRGVAAGTYGICTTAGNCVGVGGGLTSPGGSTNRLGKFNGAQSLIDSSVSDDGTNVTVNGTANLVVQGGSATLGTLTQAGSLVLSDGNAHTASLVISGLTGNRTYTIPDAGSNATFCLSTGNCVGGGGSGSAPNGAEYLVASLNGTLSNERVLTAGSNVSITDGGANAAMTVATVQNPTFNTSVTTPLLQSSGALTISSAAGQIIAIDAGATIELQDDTNVTGNFDVSGSLHAGTGNAFQISAAGSITAATGITSSGTITFSGLNCSANVNGGALTTNGSGQLVCSDDDGGAGGAVSGSGTSGTVALFNGTQSITNSIITQSGSTITIAGDLSLNTDLSVANGGTGASSFTTNGLVYGNGSGALQVTGAGTGGQVLVADASGVPTFMSLSGDVTVSNTGSVAIQPNAVTLGTDTTGNYVANLGTLTGLTATGNTGEGSTPTLSVNYGSVANTAVQGNVTLTCASGSGNLSGGGSTITLGSGGSCGAISISDSPSFATSVTSPSFVLTGAGQNGTVQVGTLGQSTVYTLPDPGAASATICLSTGNCATTGAAGGDLTGTYPNPTIAKLQGTNLTITGPTAGNILVYNGTNSRWENHALSGDIAISETGSATVQANAVALGTDTTGNYVLGLTAGTGTSVTGSAGEGWTPTVNVLYGSTAGTAVEGSQTITVGAGTNLTGGGAITLGAGGSVTLNVASSPTFSGTLTVQGASATIGTASQQGSVILNDGSSNTGTINTANLGQNTTFTLPDPGAASATICLSTGNCAGAGGGVVTGGGTVDRLSKFNGSQSIADSSISDNGSTVTLNGSVNLVVQGGTSTFGTTTQAGTIKLSDGSSNTISIVAAALSADRIYTLPDVGGDATLCVDSGNCIGGTGGAPNGAPYLVSALDATLTNERALAVGSNLTLNDGGANGSMTVGIVNNPSFSTSVTTPVLQSSGALTITSAAGNTIAIDAGTTIELQDSTNVTGNLDTSGSFTSGNANAFTINASGAITAATGITSSGTITFSGLNCSTNANGGALTTNGSGQLVCSDDDGGSGSAISGSGTSGTITMFNGTQTITNSIITQSGTTVSIAGDLSLTTALSVANGGTGATSFTSKGLIYGNGTGALQVTAAGTDAQVLVANGSGTPTFVSFSGDVAVSNTGTTTIQANSVALGTDTTGNYVGSLGTLTGLSTTGNTGEGSTPTLSVNYGSVANTAVQGNVSLTCASGTGNLSGGGTVITLGSGGSCGAISTVNNPTFTTSVTTPSMILTGAGSNGTIQVGNLGQGTVYTLPDPGGAAATICLSTGNCATTGAAGGDLTGTYPNPTIAKLQGTNLTISGPTAGQILVYNATNSRWENHAVSGDIAISESGSATVQANSVALGTDTTGNYVLGVSAGTGTSVTGSAGEGWTPTINVAYGATAATAVEGNTSISVTAGTNLSGGGSITLGGGGSVTLNVASSPTFSGTLTVQGATATIGTTTQAGSVVLSDGSSNTGTISTASLGQNTTFTLPDPGSSSATICLSTGNCAGSGTGVTTSGGTLNRLGKFTAAQAIGDSSISDNGTTVTINGTANLVVQGGTSTLGTTTQAGTLTLSDGSSNTVSIIAGGFAGNYNYTLPDVGSNATFCLSTGNCVGGGGGSAPSDATYLVTTLNGSLSNERSLTAGNNIGFTDAGANGAFTIATVNNPSFSTSVTTPLLQSSGALTITSAAGQTIAINAGTSIELQDSTNITGDLDVSVGFKAGTADAFQVTSAGAIAAATGITSSGTITFSGLNCSTNANGGSLTTNSSGMLICSDDDGGAASAISGTGTSGTITMFNGTQSIANSIITQSGTTVSIAGDLTLTTQLSVANGGTGATSFTSKGIIYGNGTSALQVTAAGTSGQVLVAGTGGTPAFVSFSGDVAVSNTGLTTIQADSVALGTDTTGNFVSNLGTLTGLSTTGNTGEGSTPTLSVTYGSIANTAVQGNVTLTCASGTGNLTGGGTSITLGTGGTCGALSTVNNPTFSTSVTTPSLVLTGAGSNGTIQVGNLGQGTVYTLPDPGAASATICLSTGNCAISGAAGGDLTGTYPNPTIAKLQNTNLTIAGPAAGEVLVYNATNSRWENHAVTGDVVLSETGTATVQANAVALGTDTTGNYVATIGTLTGLTTSGNTGEGSTPTLSVAYGSTTNTAVQGNTSLTVTAGTNLTGGGAITLGAGGTVTLNVASSPTFSGTLTVQGATASIGTTTQAGSVVLSDGSSNTGTVQTASLAQNTTFTLPDPGSSSATICLSTGNCAGSGGGVTTTGGTTNRLSKFSGAQAIADSSISDNGTTVTINGSVNVVVQGGTSTLGTTTQAGTLAISDGSSNTVSIVAAGTAADRVYTLPDVGANATFCLNTGNCIGGASGSAPADATYLVASLSGNLTNERAITAGNNVNFTDAGANGNFTVATVNNPSFSTSVTTPILQSSGALTISSGATTVAIDATTTIELQDSTNVTGNLDISGSFTSGTANAFTISSAGAITAATGITSSGTITFSGLNCSTNANGGALTTNGSGQLICSDDDGGSGSAISGTGTSGTVALFNGAQSIANSIITQSGTTINIAGDLTLNTALTVANGGTGVASFTANGIVFGNGASALGVTAAGTSGQVLVAGATGTPAFVSFSGDVAVSNTGLTAIQANSVALGTDTTGNYVGTLGTLTGLSTTGNTGEGSTPTLSVTYGSIANTAVQGNVTLTCPSGSGNLTGGGTSITLGTGGSCGAISTVNNPTFSTSVTTPSLVLTGGGSNGSIQVGTLGQSTVYTLPDPGGAAATICLSTGNCGAAGTAGGDLTGTYPNPTIAKLQNTNLNISAPAAGHVLVYNGTNSRWENHAISSDVVISETGAATIQANAVALGTDTTGNYIGTLGTLTGLSTTGNTGEGSTPTISVTYGSTANTSVQGNTSLTVTAGTNLTGGGATTLGAGGTVTLNVASSPIFSGTLTVQGATVTIGGNSVQGSVVLSDGAVTSKTATLKTSGALAQNTTYNLPDPGAASATICLTTGNCAGTGTGVTTSGGTTNRLSKFTAAQAVGDSSVSDNGTTVTINGSVNLAVQGGTSTLGTTTQAGTLTLSDGSSNTVSIVATGFATNNTYTLPDVGGAATFCLSTGNCVGSGGGAPNSAAYLVATLDGTLTNERALAAGANVTVTDGGANGNMTVATVANPTFSTSVTTPALQSSGALTITSAAGQTIAIDAGTTIELQDSTNVTGNIDISGSFTSGTANAFTISSAGAITAATGVTSSGTITFSGLNCSTNANGGALTANASGVISCSDDDGGSGAAISGSGTSGTIALFNGTQTVTNSIITQSGTTISIAGDLTLTTALSVANGGTGATSFTSNGIVFGSGTGALGVTAAGTSGQVLVAGTGGTPAFVSFSGDVAVTNTGLTTIQANSVALGTDTTGNYVGTLGTLTGLSTTGNTGEGSTPTLSVTYGSVANTSVQGNVTLTCPSGSGNLTGGGTSITLGTGGSCGAISTVNNPTFSTSVTTPSLILTGAGSNGTMQVANLGQATTFTLPDPGAAAATICLSTGNCAAAGTAGGDLTGTYPNPTIAKLQNTNLNISAPAAGHVLVYNGTNSRWENHAISSDVVINESGAATIQANAVALGTDTTGNYVGTLGTLTGLSTTGNTGEGSTPTISVTYGSTANTSVQGNTSLTVTAGTNLSGGGAVTLGAGGTVTLNVASSPIFSGTLTVQGATVTVGTNSVQGSVVLSDGGVTSKTATLKTSGTLAQNTTFNLPDPGAASATICLSSGNCAGSGTGVTTVGGTTNRLSKFSGAQAIADSTISDNGSTVTLNGSVNLVVQGGTSTLGTTTQAGTLSLSDGSSNTMSIVASGTAVDRTYTLPDVGANATFCLNTGNCVGSTANTAPNDATYLVATLNGTLTNERALAAGTNISITDGGANGNMTVATVNNPSFSTSVTTPTLQSSGALTISSGATTVAINATTTIELQDSTNVTGNLDISGTLTAGTADAFTINSAGAITAATGVTSSGTITFSGLNCSANANGGALTANASGVVSCSDDDGASGSAITGTGTTNKIALFSGAQVIGNSIISQSGTTISIAGDLTLTTALTVANGGTGAGTFTSKGIIYGNGTSALQVTAAGTSGQVLVAGATGIPAFVSFSGDVSVDNTGATVIQANSVALGTDTTGNYIGTLGTLTGLSTTGNTGEGSTPTLSVTYGSTANTAVQGSTTLTCPSGTGNLTGGGTSITLGTGGTCGSINTVASPSFTGTLTVQGASVTVGGNSVGGNLILSDGAVTSKTGTVKTATLGQNTTYTIPDPGVATASFCLTTGNCAANGSAGGDLTGSFPNPTIAKLQGATLNINTVAAGNVLVYNATNGAWENHALSGDLAINETGVATIQANAVALGADTVGNYIATLGTLTGLSTTGNTGEGSTPTLSVAYGSSTNTAVQGNTSLTVTAGTNLSGGGTITLGSGGTATINVVSAPSFTGLTVTGSSATIGANSVQGTLILDDGSAVAKTATIKTAGTLGQNTVYNLPDPAGASATICLSTGNCAGSGTGVTTAGGTTNTIAMFTGGQAIGNSILTQSGTSAINVGGNLNITTGSTYQINGTQITSAALSNDSNLAKLNAAQTFTGSTVGFKNSVDSTNGFNIQNNLNSFRVFTADTTNNQIILGQSSALNGKLVFANAANANTVTINVGTLTASRTLTLPDVGGIICTDAGNCSGTSATLQTAYTNSVGGTTPKIKLNATLQGVDIQDADTTTGANLFNIRASNGAGLGAVLFGVGNTGAITAQNSSDSANAFRVIKQGGTAVLSVDTNGNQVVLGQGGTLAGALAFSNASNANLATINSNTLTGARTATLPDASGTFCFQNSTSCGFATNTGSANYIQNQNAGAQTTSNFWISGTGRADTAFTAPLLQSAAGTALTVTGASGLTANTAATNTASTNSADLTITTGNASGTTSNSGNITINNGTANGAAGGTIGIGTANTSAISLGRTGITTTNTGAMAVTQGLSANGGLTVAANQSITMTSGTGVLTQGFSGASGNAQVLNLTDNASSGTNTLFGHAINVTGTNNAAGSNSISAVRLNNVAAATNNFYYSFNVGTGYTDILRYNNTQLISGTGFVQNAAIDATLTYTNLQKVGALTTGSIASGFGAIATTNNISTSALVQGGTGAFTAANGLTLGTSSSATGGIVLRGSGGTGTLTLAGPTTPNAGNFTLSLPAITANATVCTTNSTCAGYAPATGGTGYIQNQSAAQQASSSFWISNNGRIDGTLNANTITGTTGDILIQSATQTISFGGSNYITATGGYTLQAGANSDLTVLANGTGTLQLGTNATANRVINVGSTSGNGTASTVNIGTSTTAAQTINIGSTNGASTTTISAGTGDLLLQTNAAAASIIAKASTDGSNAFQIQDAAGTSMLNVDTIKNVISINNGTGSQLTAFSALSNTLNTSISFAGSVVANGFIYAIGGHNASPSSVVQFAPIKSDGTLGTWATTSALPAARDYTVESVSTYNNFIYVVLGTANGTTANNTVYFARVTSDGTLTAWATATEVIGTGRYAVSTVVANGFIYALGGLTNSTTLSTAVNFAKIKADGSIEPWQTSATTLPAATAWAHMSAVYVNGKIFLMGGVDTASTSKTQVYYGTVNAATGDVTGWTSNTNVLPAATSTSSALYYNGYMYVVNGGNNAMYVSQLSTTAAQPLGAWSTVSLSPMTGSAGRFTTQYNGYFYVMGGGASGSNTVYSASAARTQIKGALDLVGTSDGIVAGDGPAGGSLTVGDANVVGKLNVQGSANFSQGASVTDSLSVVAANDSYAGISIMSDLDNVAGEPGGSYLNISVDGSGNTATMGTVGLTQVAGVSPDGSTSITNGTQNAMIVGSLIGSGNLQFITSSTSAGANARMTIMYGSTTDTTHVCINVNTCTKTLGVSGTIGATGAINGSGAFNTTGGADLAEYIHAASDVAIADVVMADPDNTERVVKATGAYNDAAVGVISDPEHAGFVSNVYGDLDGNTTDPDAKPLTLAGRVLVKVTNEGGQIKPGDHLTTSSTPGKAMKATHAGPTIGKALGFFDGANGDGTVLVLVSSGYYSPALQGADNGSFSNLNASGNVNIGGNLTVTGLTTVNNILVNGHIVTAGTTPTAEVQAAAGANAVVTITGNDTAGRIEITTGTAPTADDLAKLIFHTAYTGMPEVVITPLGKGSAAAQSYVDSVADDSFMVGANGTLQPNTKYVFIYHVIGTSQ